MKKIVFDASIHLGQFCISNERTRIACKNSQAAISRKEKDGIQGIITFNENSWVDHVIWKLPRKEQDEFYPFMDLFHSSKGIERVPLDEQGVRLALRLPRQFNIPISQVLTCSIAIQYKANEVHTFYKALVHPQIVRWMKEKHGITVTTPPYCKEQSFEQPQLERRYQKALDSFRKARMNPWKSLPNAKS